MRHTIKPLLTTLLALLALAALTSTASAATCKKGTLEAEHKVLCVEGKQVGSTESKVTTSIKFKQKAGASVVLNVPAQNWSVSCSSVETFGSPVIKSGGSGQVTLEALGFRISECKVTQGGKEQPKCVAEGFGTYALSGSIALPESISLGGSTESFGSIELGGSCPVSGIIPIKGTQGCSLKQAEVEAVAKELVCEAKNSHLTFGGGYGGPPTLALEGSLELAGTSKGEKYSITK
jgi:hypothetical protein